MTASAILEAGQQQTEEGVTTQHLWIDGHEGRRVPALMFTPENAGGPRPVVMLGHGAGGRKDEPQMLAIARWLVLGEGWACAVIDGPVHGERRSDGRTDVGEEGLAALMDRETFPAMAADWQRTVDACGELPDVGNEAAAYLGFSMGAVLGIPTVAEEPRFRCAVFAIGGIQAERPNLLSRAAARIDRPVLLVNQSEDELFSREAVFRLFDPIAGPKSVTFYPGAHGEVPREAMEQMRAFLRAHLAGKGEQSDAPPGVS